MESRSLPVPDGLDGTRVDAALAKLLGFSRTFAAEVAASGGVRLDGVTLDKSDRLRGGARLDVEWEPKEGPKIVPIAVPELGIVYDDDDIVVVDTPDALLVTTREHAQRVKSVVDALKLSGRTDVL